MAQGTEKGWDAAGPKDISSGAGDGGRSLIEPVEAQLMTKVPKERGSAGPSYMPSL